MFQGHYRIVNRRSARLVTEFFGGEGSQSNKLYTKISFFGGGGTDSSTHAFCMDIAPVWSSYATESCVQRCWYRYPANNFLCEDQNKFLSTQTLVIGILLQIY